MSPTVRYSVHLTEPHKHVIHVTAEYSGFAGDSLEIMIPTWSPGSYMIREFSRNILDISIRDKKPGLSLVNTNKNSWLITHKDVENVTIDYQIYAFEEPIRATFIDADQAMLHGASLFILPRVDVEVNYEIIVNHPEEWGVITTQLPHKPGHEKFLFTDSLEKLLDSPIAVGNHTLYPFMVTGIPHQFAMLGQGNYELDAIIRDTRKALTTAHAIFGEVPYDSYTFFISPSNGELGGLEHHDSCNIQVGRFNFQDRGDYIKFITLVVHEFFHSYNVKKFKPESFINLDLEHENYTTLHWVTEGINSYYDKYLLLRGGVITLSEYLSLIQNDIVRLQSAPGRLRQSLSESSFYTWIKHYFPDENSDNVNVSYYLKGSLVGMALDLEIRTASKGAKSLDDIFRALWRNYKKGQAGYTETSFRQLCESNAGRNLDNIWKYVDTTAEMDFPAILEPYGLQVETTSNNNSQIWLGIKVQEIDMVVSQIIDGGSAHECGINVKDELVAVNGIRLTRHNYKRHLSRLPHGVTAQITVTRNGYLRQIPMTPILKTPEVANINKLDELSDEQKILFRNWLREDWQPVDSNVSASSN